MNTDYLTICLEFLFETMDESAYVGIMVSMSMLESRRSTVIFQTYIAIYFETTNPFLFMKLNLGFTFFYMYLKLKIAQVL